MNLSTFSPALRDLCTAGDVVQIDPRVPGFGSCFMVVTGMSKKHATGYIQQPGRVEAPIYTRQAWKDLEFVGKASWLLEVATTGALQESAVTEKRRQAAASLKAGTKANRK